MKRKFALGALRLTSNKSIKDDNDEPLRTEMSPTSPTSEDPLTPTDSHPPALHRRSKLDPTVEIELRRACAIILRDLKPSGHDLEDTRMKQDILVEANSTPPNNNEEMPNEVPIMPMPVNRSGQRAAQLAANRLSRTTDTSGDGDGSWPLSQTMSVTSATSKGRRSRPMSYDSLSGRPFAYGTKARVDAIMGTASGPTSPLREEFSSGLAPTQTRTMVSPVTAGESRPLSGYLLEDYFQAPEQAAVPNTESLSSTDSSATNHTGSTNHGRSLSTELSSTAFTTPSNRVSGLAGAATAASAWPPSAERKTFDTVEEAEQDSVMVTDDQTEEIPVQQEEAKPVSARTPLAIKEVLIPSRRPSAVPSSNVRSASEAQQAMSPTMTSGHDLQNGEQRYQHLEVKPLTIRRIPSKETSILQERDANHTSIFNSPSTKEDIAAPLVELPKLPPVDYDKPLPPITAEQESPTIEAKENVPPNVADDYSQIKAMKLENIKDKSDEPLAHSRVKLASRPNSMSGAELLALPNYANYAGYDGFDGFDALKTVVKPISEASSFPASRPETATGQGRAFSPMPENAATAASKTHQWPITAPVEQITPLTEAPPTPSVASPVPPPTTHQQDNTVYVKDFWRPASPARSRSRGGPHFSNEPNVQSRETDNEMPQRPIMLNSLKTDMANESVPSWTAGPDTSIFNNPRSQTPDSPVSNMVRALPSTSTRPKSPSAMKAGTTGSRAQSMTSTLSAPPLNALDNKSLPPIPRTYAQEGYFPTTSPNYNTMTPKRSMASISYVGPNTSVVFNATAPNSSTTNTNIRTPTVPQTPQQLANSAKGSMTNFPDPRTTSTLSNQTQTHTLKPLSHRDIPPYIPGYGHIDPAAISAAKRQAGINAPYSSPQKPSGFKGLLFKLGGGDMPASRGSGGGWKAPPVTAWGAGWQDEGLYEDDYDEMACAAPVVPFGRGW